MSTLFISHSSRDNEHVVDFRSRLERQGYRSLFIDFDPQLGIPAGRDWEQELYRQLKRCRALVALVSDRWLESRWCFAELTQARALGKPVFPVLIGPCEVSGLLTDRQVVDVAAVGESAWERLWIGLQRAGLDPRDVFERDPARAPYPGLDAFQHQDAAVYFGREAEVAEALEALQRMRRRQEPRLLTVLGASGSGKSSLVRAGVLPRLAKDTERWVSLAPFRPGDDPAGALARTFAEALGRGDEWKEIRDRLASGGSRAIRDLAHDLAAASGRAEAVLVVVDQFDELLGKDVSGAAADFLRQLRGALGGPLYALLTLRSDFLGTFQKHPELRDLAFANLTLGPMPVARFPEVVEGPAERVGVELEAGLVGRMVREAETDDALPLLAFTLREMWEREAERSPELPRFTTADYEALGGIQGAVARAADDVLGADLGEADERVLRSAFLKMVRINDEGQYARRPIHLDALPEGARKWIDRFAAARLLVIRGDGGGATVEVAHEALFRVWKKLVGWLAEERELLLWRQRLRSAEKEWQRTSRDESALLRGTPLAEAERWLAERGDELEDSDLQFVQESAALRQRQEAERQRQAAERERRRRLQVRAASAAAAVFLGLATLAGFFWRRSEAERQRVMARQLASQAALVGGDRDDAKELTQSILLAAESLRSAPTREGTREVFEGTRRVARRPPAAIAAEGIVHAVAFSPDGRLLATGGDQLRLWDPASREPVSPPLPGGGIRSLAFDPLERWIAAGEDRRIRIWQLDAWTEVTEIETQGPVVSLGFSPDGTTLAAADEEPGVLLIATEGWRSRRLATTDRVLDVAFAPDRPLLAVATVSEVSLWNPASGRKLYRIPGTPRAVGVGPRTSPVVAMSGGDVSVLNLDEEALRQLEASTGAELPYEIPYLAAPEWLKRLRSQEQLALSRDGTRLAVAGSQGSVWAGALDAEDASLALHASAVASLAFSPDGRRLATADEQAWLWESSAAQEAARLEHGRPVVDVAASPVDLWVATADDSGTVRIFRPSATGDWQEAHRAVAAGAVAGLAFSPDGAWLAATGDRIRIFAADSWRIAHQEELPVPGSHPVFTPDGRWLVLGKHRGTFAAVVETGTWRRTELPLADNQSLASGFRPDGNRLAFDIFTYRTRGTLTWDPATGEVSDPEEDAGSAAGPELSYAESATDCGLFEARVKGSRIELRDPATGQTMTSLAHEAEVHALAVTSDGRWLLSAGADGLVKIWPLQADDLVAHACARVPRNLTEEEWVQFVGEDEPYRLTCPKPAEPVAPSD